ncbi:MAG: hypothetical protein ACI88A_002854 [Paraglaciecola sp.]|jgi:hypothetical protein
MSTQTQTVITQSTYSVKWSIWGLFTYVFLTIIGSVILSSMWMSQNDIAGLSSQEIGILMEQDTGFAIYTSMLGLLSALFCGWFVSIKTQGGNYTAALIIAVCLAVYGSIGIVVHPEHQVLHQIGKIVVPFVACALGAWIAMLKHNQE